MMYNILDIIIFILPYFVGITLLIIIAHYIFDDWFYDIVFIIVIALILYFINPPFWREQYRTFILLVKVLIGKM